METFIRLVGAVLLTAGALLGVMTVVKALTLS